MHPSEQELEEMRREVVALVRALNVENLTLSSNAACRIKDLVLASNPYQRVNQDLITSVDGAIDGLVTVIRRGSAGGKYHACYALAQLAWSNQRNSLFIPSVCLHTFILSKGYKTLPDRFVSVCRHPVHSTLWPKC